MIKNCAAAKIPCIKYNMSILGVLQTGRVPGRGDTMHNTYKLKDARAGVVNSDPYWERFTYFPDRVIPVANKYKVRMACSVYSPSDSGGEYTAFVYGYIRALIQAVDQVG
jgi:mannonate dehydratase